MEAEGWTYCPYCTKRLEENLKAQEDAIIASYGSVSIKTFDQMRDSLSQAKRDFAGRLKTFFEKVSIVGAPQGAVIFRYTGRCDRCDEAPSFETIRPFPKL